MKRRLSRTEIVLFAIPLAILVLIPTGMNAGSAFKQWNNTHPPIWDNMWDNALDKLDPSRVANRHSSGLKQIGLASMMYKNTPDEPASLEITCISRAALTQSFVANAPRNPTATKKTRVRRVPTA